MRWFKKQNPTKGDVYVKGNALPESDHETATGRQMYTITAIRKAYDAGTNDSRELLVKCRNLLSHPAHWGANDEVVIARRAVYSEVCEFLGES